MGNERQGMTRITFFVSDNLAIQIKEDAYLNRKSLTRYLQTILLEKIKNDRRKNIEDERTRQLEDAQKDMSTL